MGETNTTGINLARLTPNILIPLPDHDFDPTECAYSLEGLHFPGMESYF